MQTNIHNTTYVLSNCFENLNAKINYHNPFNFNKNIISIVINNDSVTASKHVTIKIREIKHTYII